MEHFNEQKQAKYSLLVFIGYIIAAAVILELFFTAVDAYFKHLDEQKIIYDVADAKPLDIDYLVYGVLPKE